MSQPAILGIDDLQAIITRIFLRAGLTPPQADAVAGTITAGERDGCKSHGIYRIESCLQTIRGGKVNPIAEPVLQDHGSAIIRVDAGDGFSPLAFQRGAPVLAERARKLGLAALTLNNCVHFSALWPEIEALTGQGLAAMAMCPSYSAVAPWGGTRALLGTNPFAFGWPRRDGTAYVFDIATSAAARGEVELLHKAGKPIPEGWAIDPQGRPTTDPAAALKGALLPFGGHKGSAIATMIELLSGPMIGDLNSREALTALGSLSMMPRHGELILAFDPAQFAAGRLDPIASAEAIIDGIAGQGARLPSQRRYAARRLSETEGIRLSADEVALLDRLDGTEGPEHNENSVGLRSDRQLPAMPAATPTP